jgi:hypothetical protein
MRRRRTIARVGLTFAVTLALASGSALAYFSSGGGGTASAAVTTLSAPTISVATPASGGTVALTWSAVSAPGGGTVNYYVTRNGGLPAETCPDVNGPEPVTTCTDTGLSPGTYEYKVIAVWSSWSKASVVKSATVTVGPVAKFTITGSTSTPATGVGDSLTITAKDAAGGTVTTYTGSHTFTFAGASPSAEGKVPTVVNAAGTAIPFGEPTALTFTNGVAAAASSKNGFMQIYKPGEAKITATEGSLTTPVPLAVNVLPTASRFVITAATTTPSVGDFDALTIKAYDAYGNPSTNYTGTKSLVFAGPAASPSGKAATVESTASAQVNIGTATPIAFVEGVATANETTPGAELTLYKSGATTLTAKEGTTVTTPTALTLTPTPDVAASLTLTASATANVATTTAISLTTTAKDEFGNTATSYTGAKNLTFTASGAATETSPAGNVAGVNNSSGTQIAFGGVTAITFTNGVAAVTSSKNGVLRLFKPGSASLTVSDGTFTSPALAFTMIAVAKRVSVTSLTSSAGTVSTTCLFTCTVTGLGNSGTISAALTITDEYGNQISAIGSGKTVTLTTGGTTGSTVSPTSLTVAETGTATTTAKFTFTAPSGTGAFTTTVTAASTGYTSATITASK